MVDGVERDAHIGQIKIAGTQAITCCPGQDSAHRGRCHGDVRDLEIDPRTLRQITRRAKEIRRLGKDITHTRTQRFHLDGPAINRIEAKALIIIVINGKDKAEWLPLSRAGVTDNRWEENGGGNAVDEWIIGSFGA